jgi:hypothetical protein
MAAHSPNPGTQEAETGTLRVQGRSGLYIETLSEKQQQQQIRIDKNWGNHIVKPLPASFIYSLTVTLHKVSFYILHKS